MSTTVTTGPTTATKICPFCGEEIRLAAQVCRFCHAELDLARRGYCLACHAVVNVTDARLCERCGGAVVDARAEAVPVPPAAPQPAAAVSPPPTLLSPPVVPTPPPPRAPSPPVAVSHRRGPARRAWLLVAATLGVAIAAALGWQLFLREPESPPLTPRQYETLLDTSSSRIRAALGEVRAAKTYNALVAKVAKAERVITREQNRLADRVPPEKASRAHDQLVAALARFGDAVDDVRAQVASLDLAGAPSVMARLGRTAAAADLRGVTRRMERVGFGTGSLAPPRVPMPNRRLPNGTVTTSLTGSGRGELTVKNGPDVDAVVRLVKGGETVASVYVRRRSAATIEGIPDGRYRVFYTGGVDWDRRLGAFTRDSRFERFDDAFPFETTWTGTGSQWRTWTITLYEVAGGQAATSRIPPAAFPK
jgi:hypothetical protein